MSAGIVAIVGGFAIVAFAPEIDASIRRLARAAFVSTSGTEEQ